MNKLFVLPFHETSKQNNWQTPMKLKWISKQITKERRKHLHVFKNQCDVFSQNLGWRVYNGGHNYTVKYPEIKKIKSSQHSNFFSISFSVIKIKYTYLVLLPPLVSAEQFEKDSERWMYSSPSTMESVEMENENFIYFSFKKGFFFKKPTINARALMSLQAIGS